MPLPDERPRQSVANLIGKFEQGGKRGSGSNGAGVARRQSQGVLSSIGPAMPLKAQLTGQSTSAISVQSGPRSPPIRPSELKNTTGTDVTSWRKTTLPQATVPPAPEISQPDLTPTVGTELQETTPTEQIVTYDEPTAAPVSTEPEKVTTPRPPPEKSTKTRPVSNAGTSSTAKPKVASSIATKPTASGPSRTAKPPTSSRPSTLSKATASGAAKSSRPSVVPPVVAPLKPQVTGGSTTTSRLSAPTAASKARIAGTASSSNTSKPSASSSSTVKRAVIGQTAASPPRKVVPKSTPAASGASAPAKKAPLPRSTVSMAKATTTTVRKPAVPSASTTRTTTTSRTPSSMPITAPRVGLAGAGRVKNPSGPAKLAAAGSVTTGVPLLQGDKKELSTKEAPVAVDQPQESNDAPVEAQNQDEGVTVALEVTMENVDEPGDETIMQKSDVNGEEVHLDETTGHGEPTEEHLDDANGHEEPAGEHLDETGSYGDPTDTHLDDASSHEEAAEDHLDETGSHAEPGESLVEADAQGEDEHVGQEEIALSETAGQEVEAPESVVHDDEDAQPAAEEDEGHDEGEMSMDVDDADADADADAVADDEGEHPEQTVLREGDDEGEVYEEQPLEEVQEDHDQADASEPPPHTENASTPSEDEGGGGDLEDAVALLEGGQPAKMVQPVDLFSPGYAEEHDQGTALAQEASPNPSQREVGDIPDDE